jgi:leucyl-tRNA synthetase
MSKSKNNGVDPQTLIEKYGADTARLFMMFASPPEQTLEWSDSGVEGSYRFLKRLWGFAHDFSERVEALNSKRSTFLEQGVRIDKTQMATRFEIHSVLRQANHDLSKNQFNTVISAAMKILNALGDYRKLL